MEHSFLSDILLLLGGSIPVVVLLRRLAVPPLAGFVVVGAILGPHALGWIRSNEEIEALAEIGVALLLFTVGLEFSVPRLLLLRRAILVGGAGQVLGTIAVATAAASLFGASVEQALLFGFLAALSSTALVLKSLADEHQIDTPHGQHSVAILLTQDLAVIPMLLFLPVLAGEAGGGPLAVLTAVGKAVLGVAVVVLAARYGFSRLAAIVVRAGGRELFTLFIVLVALGAAWLTQTLELPLALGAFVAGLVISESEYSHQVVDEILPFRDVFSALFFVSVGMLFDFTILVREPLLSFGLSLAVGASKALIVFALVLFLTRSRRVAFLTAAALFQIGEFSFVIAREAGQLGLIGEAETQRFLAVAVLTMLLTPFAVQGARRWSERATAETDSADSVGERSTSDAQVLIAGYGLTGQHLARVLDATAISFRVIEQNPERVRRETAAGTPIMMGDVGRADALVHAGLLGARVFVVAVNDPASTRRAVALARGLAPGVQIIARTRFLTDTEELLRLGATQVVPQEFETSLAIFGLVLRELHVPRGTIAVQTELIRREGYQLLRTSIPDDRHLSVIGDILASTAVDTLFVGSDCGACGRTLAELAFKKRTGASVLSAIREGTEIHGPDGDFRLEPGDLLIVRGDHPDLDRARDLIAGTLRPEDERD